MKRVIMVIMMSIQSREKLALVVFLGLMVLSLLGFGWYLLAGHSWNVAASNIDDTFGSMEGYTAIVYPGTDIVKAYADTTGDVDAATSAGTTGSVGATDGASDDDVQDVEENPIGASESDVYDTDTQGDDESVVEAVDETDDPADEVVPPVSQDQGVTGDDGGTTNSSSGGSSLTKKKSLSVDEVQESYESKKATVFTLDTINLDRYREGTIVRKGNHRFGVFSIAEPMSSIMLEKQIAYFQRYSVDFIVAITPDKAYVDDVAGLDIVICTQDEGLFVMGETIDSTFFVDAPEVGKVGTILISPSNVVSAKVLEEV